MKKKVGIGFLVLGVAIAVRISVFYYGYRQVMDTVSIIHYIKGSGSGYSTVYVTAVVPRERYCGDRTLESIRMFVYYRDREIPDTLQMVLYDSMDSLREGDSYMETVFRKGTSR